MQKLSLIKMILILILTFSNQLMAISKAGEEIPLAAELITKLSPCPNKPNCVQSFNREDQAHYEAPWELGSVRLSPSGTLKDFVKNKILAQFSSAKLVKEEDFYLHFEFTSRLFKFVDDVEFIFLPDGIVHFRSASRVGYSDLGVNKKRIKQISELLKN